MSRHTAVKATLFVAVALFCALHAFADTTYNIAAGASVSTINSTIATAAAAAGNNTVQFAAGAYTVTTQVSVPCPVGTLTIQGPVVAYVPPSDLRAATYSYTTPYTAHLNGPVDGNWGFNVAACASGHNITIQYLEWDGHQPVDGGGGWIFLTRGSNDFTLQYNYCHGMYASTTTGHWYDGCVWLDGPQAPTPITANTLIQWNVIGDGHSDCNPIMNIYNYQGGQYGAQGAQCMAVAWQVSTRNLQILNNDFEHLEQGLKGVAHGSAVSGAIYADKDIFEYNDFGQIHRIGFESQQFINVNQTTPSYWIVRFNSDHDVVAGSYGTWGFSLPQCCGGYLGINSDEETTADDNTMIGNSPPTGTYYAGGFEYWSHGGTYGHANNNFGQGYWGAGKNSSGGYGGGDLVDWGCSTGTPLWAANNNLMESPWGAAAVADEGTQNNPSACPTSPEVVPTQSGNVSLTTISQRASTAPVITPAAQAISAPITVTITNPGDQSGLGPRLNQHAFCTLNGTTPTVNSTFYASGSTLTIPPGTTIKCIGMWGHQNQPHVWPSGGYGWAPSAVVSQTYSASGTRPTFTSVVVTLPQASLTAGATGEVATAACKYSDGSSYDCSLAATPYSDGPVTFATSDATVASIVASGTGSGMITPVAVGNVNISASAGVLTSAKVSLGVVAAGTGTGGTTGGAGIFLGNSAEDYSGTTYANYFNSVYSVTPASGGPWTPGACHFYILGTVQSGKHWDCLIIAAPSATTQASTPLCKATYTTTSTTGPGQVNITPTGCGTLANSTAYWAATITDDTTNPEGLGFYDCGSTCAGSAPTAGGGSGTYPGYYVGITYGAYTSLPSAFTGTNPRQASLWVDLTSSTPTLVSAYQDNTGSINTMVRGAGYQQHVYCVYSDAIILPCDTTNARGDAVSSWGVSNTLGPVLSIGATTTSSSIDASLTNWETVCTHPGACDPGGTDTAASTSQTVGNASPSLDGASMLLSLTTNATSTQTNVLWRYLSPTTCDLCTTFSSTSHLYMPTLSSLNNYEFGVNDFDHTEHLQLTFEHQCNLATNKWQIADGAGSWVNTAVSCNLTAATWHTVTTTGHRILGDTSCGGYPTLYFDSITVDGTLSTLNQTLCAIAFPTGASGLIMQYQIDQGATTSATTRSMYLDETSFTVSSGSTGLVTGVNYGQSQSTCTIDGTLACSPWTWTVTNMPATADVYTGVKLSGVQVQ